MRRLEAAAGTACATLKHPLPVAVAGVPDVAVETAGGSGACRPEGIEPTHGATLPLVALGTVQIGPSGCRTESFRSLQPTGAWPGVLAARHPLLGRLPKSADGAGLREDQRRKLNQELRDGAAALPAQPHTQQWERIFLILDNGPSHHPSTSSACLVPLDPRIRTVHLPTHSGWLYQVEIYFSILVRKALTPRDSPVWTRSGTRSTGSRVTATWAPSRSTSASTAPT